MTKLYKEIEIKNKSRYVNTKASESYIDVTFKYNDTQWDGWVPVEYRRTGVNISDGETDELYRYLNSIYDQMNPKNYRVWLQKEDARWSHSRSVETKEIFNLLKDGKWHCRNCEINNPNFARRIQDLKEMGYTIATHLNYHCPKCGNNRSTRLLLLPIDRVELAGNGYETWSPALRKRILRLFNYIDAYEGTVNRNCLPDHKFSEIRWDDDTKKVKNGMGTWLAVFDHEGDVVASISKRPDHKPIEQILDEHGDEIFKDADSIVIEIDIDREIVKKTFHYAEKYKKKVYAIVSNMTIAIERRDFIRRTECFVCNQQEAGILFSEDYEEMSAEELSKVLSERIQSAKIPKMVVTMGGEGAVYADQNGESGVYPALKVDVVDTTGAGDAFFSGVCIGLTYGKTLREACEIGTRLASTVICTSENICPRFMPEEFGITR